MAGSAAAAAVFSNPRSFLEGARLNRTGPESVGLLEGVEAVLRDGNLGGMDMLSETIAGGFDSTGLVLLAVLAERGRENVVSLGAGAAESWI